jgi:hypothetical protein
VILTAYMDESGTHDGSSYTTMSAVLANVAQWEMFEANFNKIRAEFGFRIFHTKKFRLPRME